MYVHVVEKKKKPVTFGDLYIGDIFYSSPNTTTAFMRIGGTDETEVNAVCMTGSNAGIVTHFENGKAIVPVDAELTIIKEV